MNRVAVTILQWVVGLQCLYGSAMLAFGPAEINSFQHHIGLPAWVRLSVAFVEIAAALIFLFPRTAIAGGAMLLFTFFVVAVIHILHGQPNVSFLVLLGAAVWTVMTYRQEKMRTA